MIIAEHAVGQQGFVVRSSGSAVAVQKAAVIEITEAQTHGENHAIQTHPVGDICERAVAVVVMEARLLGLIWQAWMEG